MTSSTSERILELSFSHENDCLQERIEYVFLPIKHLPWEDVPFLKRR